MKLSYNKVTKHGVVWLDLKENHRESYFIHRERKITREILGIRTTESGRKSSRVATREQRTDELRYLAAPVRACTQNRPGQYSGLKEAHGLLKAWLTNLPLLCLSLSVEASATDTWLTHMSLGKRANYSRRWSWTTQREYIQNRAITGKTFCRLWAMERENSLV